MQFLHLFVYNKRRMFIHCKVSSSLFVFIVLLKGSIAVFYFSFRFGKHFYANILSHLYRACCIAIRQQQQKYTNINRNRVNISYRVHLLKSINCCGAAFFFSFLLTRKLKGSCMVQTLKKRSRIADHIIKILVSVNFLTIFRGR